MSTFQPTTFEFDIESILDDIYQRHPDMEVLEDRLVGSCAQLEQTYVFFELPRTAQFREVQAWLDTYYGLEAVVWMDYTGVALDAMYRQWHVPSVPTEDNVLATPFGKTVATFLIRHGTPVSIYANTFGWMDALAWDEMRTTEPVAIYHIHSERWTEFEDTLTGELQHAGFSAYMVFASGLERYVRYEGDLVSIVRELTDDQQW